MKKVTAASKTLPCGRPLAPAPPPPNEAKLQEMQTRLRQYLVEKELKYTEQRWSIIKIILLAGGGHLDSQQIVEKVNSAYPEIGAATVYRNIKLLCDAQLLVESHQDVSGRVLYELPQKEHHDHIICLDCGHVFEFHDEKIEKLQEKVSEDFSFDLAGHKHVIHGRCSFLKR